MNGSILCVLITVSSSERSTILYNTFLLKSISAGLNEKTGMLRKYKFILLLLSNSQVIISSLQSFRENAQLKCRPVYVKCNGYVIEVNPLTLKDFHLPIQS